MAAHEDTIKTVRQGRKNAQHKEGAISTAVKEQKAKKEKPKDHSDLFLLASVGVTAVSFGLHLAGKKKLGNLMSQLPTNILLIGLYKKLIG